MLANDMLHNYYGDGTSFFVDRVRDKLKTRLRLPLEYEITEEDKINGILAYDYGAVGKVVKEYLRDKIYDAFSNTPSLTIYATASYSVDSALDTFILYCEAVGKEYDENKTYFNFNMPDIVHRITTYTHVSKELLLDTIRVNTIEYDDISECCEDRWQDEVMYKGIIYYKEHYHQSQHAYFFARKNTVVYSYSYMKNRMVSMLTGEFLQKYNNDASISILAVCAEEDILRLRRNRLKKIARIENKDS